MSASAARSRSPETPWKPSAIARTPRFIERRTDHAVLIIPPGALDQASYAARLGAEARRLAAADRLPSPARVIETLLAVTAPPSVTPPPEFRLVRLGATLAGVALSPRLELYPKGMAGAQALQLSRSALLGAAQLTEAEIRARVAERFPEAEPVPGCPTLDELLRNAGLQLEWHSASQTFRDPEPPPEYSSSVSLHRQATVYAPPSADLSPSEGAVKEDAWRAERALESSISARGFLVLDTAPEYALDAVDELTRRFPVQLLDCDRILLAAMRARAAARRVDWNRIIAADDSADELMEPSETACRASHSRFRVTRPSCGWSRAAHQPRPAIANSPSSPPARRPARDTSKLMIDGHPVPIYSDSQWVRLDRAGIENLHRGAAHVNA